MGRVMLTGAMGHGTVDAPSRLVMSHSAADGTTSMLTQPPFSFPRSLPFRLQYGLYDDDEQIETLNRMTFDEMHSGDEIWVVNFYSTR